MSYSPGNPPTSPQKWYQYLIYTWIFIPAALYYKMVYQYALNIPWRDDYDAVLNFLWDYKHASFAAKIGLLFSQHNEHRMFPARMTYVLYDALFGKIDFRHLIFIGDLQLMVIFLISIHFIRRSIPKYWSIVSFIWGLCLFELNGWENSIVTMTALCNFGVMAMFFISLFFYSLDKKVYLAPAVLFQILCMFSSGGGVIGSIFIVAFTVLSGQKKKSIASIATLVVFTAVYFANYTNPTPPKVPTTLDNEIIFFLSMLGTHFSFVHGFLFGIILLTVLFFTHPFGKKLSISINTLPFVCILGYVMATMAATSLFRSNLVGSIYWASKYLIYPNLLAALVFLFVCMKLQDKKIFWPVTAVLILGMLQAYSTNYQYGKDNFITESHNLKTLKYYYPDQTRAKEIADNACKAGFYCIEEHRN